MKITKRDIADIVLVVMVFAFIYEFFRSIFTLAYHIGTSSNEFGRGASITSYAAKILIILAVNYLLLFKRYLVLAILFPDAKDKEVALPEGLTALTSYAFWIRLFGIFFFLKSFVSFGSQVIRDLAMNAKFPDGSFAWTSCMYSLVSLILAGIIIWKSDWLGTKLENKKSSNQSTHSITASGGSE